MIKAPVYFPAYPKEIIMEIKALDKESAEIMKTIEGLL